MANACRRRIAALLLAAMMLGACGQPASTEGPSEPTEATPDSTDFGTQETPDSTDPAQETAPSGRQSPRAGTSPSGRPQSKAQRTYPLPSGGPTDEIFPGPPGDKPFDLLSQGRCRELLRMVNSWGPSGARDPGRDATLVYRGAAHACLHDWEKASADLAQLRSRGARFSNCAARSAALRWLEDLVLAHEQDPSFAPSFVANSRRGSASACEAGGSDESAEESERGSPDEQGSPGQPESPGEQESDAVDDRPSGGGDV